MITKPTTVGNSLWSLCNYVCAVASVVYISVMPAGTTCDSSSSRILSATAANLAKLGFYNQEPDNLAPDWGLIKGRSPKDGWGS